MDHIERMTEESTAEDWRAELRAAFESREHLECLRDALDSGLLLNKKELAPMLEYLVKIGFVRQSDVDMARTNPGLVRWAVRRESSEEN